MLSMLRDKFLRGLWGPVVGDAQTRARHNLIIRFRCLMWDGTRPETEIPMRLEECSLDPNNTADSGKVELS